MAMARFSVRERWPGTLYGRRHPFTDHVSQGDDEYDGSARFFIKVRVFSRDALRNEV